MAPSKAPRLRTATSPSAVYAERVAEIRSALRAADADGYLVTNRMDQYWLTGFTGEDGAVLITPRSVVLLTDGRFAEAAETEAPWAKAVIRPTRGPETLADAIVDAGAGKISFDPDDVTVSALAGVKAGLRKKKSAAKLVPAAGLIRRRRQLKSDQELRVIQRAVRIAEAALVAVRPLIEPGRTEREIAARLVFEMQQRGATGPAFAPIVAAAPNSSLPHYTPGAKKIAKNDLVLIDWGARLDWFVSDLTRVVAIGRVPPQLSRVHRIVFEAKERAIRAARPGITAGELDAVARNHIAAAGFGAAFGHALGHGLGLDVHEGPRIGRESRTVLEPGMVVTIEPGIYLPGVGGVRLEDDVVITPRGCRVLSSLTSEPL